ncbi:MAG: hypothetical protein V3W44_02120 [Dehalococcoidales bacterium]
MIEIISAELLSEEGAADTWICWLEISQMGQTWMLPATASGGLLEGELQAHFDGRGGGLWQIADAEQYAPDIYEHLMSRRVLKAFAAVMLDELNILRQQHGLAARTAGQLRDAIKGKL